MKRRKKAMQTLRELKARGSIGRCREQYNKLEISKGECLHEKALDRNRMSHSNNPRKEEVGQLVAEFSWRGTEPNGLTNN